MDKIPHHIRKSLIILMPVFWLSVIVLALNVTSPIMAGPAGILVVFLLFYAFTASTLYVLTKTATLVLRFIRKDIVISDPKSLQISCVLAMGPIFLIALNTLGRIGFVEVILVSVLVGLACFYVVRRSAA